VPSLEDHGNHHSKVIQSESNGSHYPELLQSLDTDEGVPTTSTVTSTPQQVRSGVLSKPATPIAPAHHNTQGNPLLHPTFVTPDVTAACRNKEELRQNLLFQAGNPGPLLRGVELGETEIRLQATIEDDGKLRKKVMPTATVPSGRFWILIISPILPCNICHVMQCNSHHRGHS
jgi:hypothetical protein